MESDGQMTKLISNGPKLPNGDLELQDASATFVLGTPVSPSCSLAITPICCNIDAVKPAGAH